MCYLFKAYIHSLTYYALYNGLKWIKYIYLPCIQYIKNTMYVSTQQCHTCIHQNTCVTAAHQNSCRLSQGQRGLGKFWGSWYHMPSVTFDSKLRHQPIMWTLGTCPASVTTKRSFFFGKGRKKKSGSKISMPSPAFRGRPHDVLNKSSHPWYQIQIHPNIIQLDSDP